MRSLAEALRFLSIIPIPGKPPKKPSRILAAYPWAGLILGILAALSALPASLILGAAGTAVLVMAVRIGITGALHLDGVSDLADGIGGGRDIERRLAIMADSRIGSFGTSALLVLTALQTVLIFELLNSTGTWTPGRPPLTGLLPIIAAPVISRGLLPLIMRLFPSARPGGMGDRSKRTAGKLSTVFALASTVLLSWLLTGAAGPVTVVVVFLFLYLIAAGISKRLGGLTGDVYGALIEFGDLITFLAMLIIVHLRFFICSPLCNLLY